MTGLFFGLGNTKPFILYLRALSQIIGNEYRTNLRAPH
jgi:hypothetical protein